MLIDRLVERKLIHPPKWLPTNVVFLSLMGSHGYGMNQEDSDFDYFGICVPKKEIIFSHLAGVIPGFGHQGQSFDQWNESHIYDKDSDKEYDFTIFGIVKMFELTRLGNPNMIDMLFCADSNIVHINSVGQLIRENRHKFLSKHTFSRLKGYSYSMIKKMHNAEDDEDVAKLHKLEDQLGIPHNTTFNQAFTAVESGHSWNCSHREAEDYYYTYREYTLKSKRFEDRKIHAGLDSKYATHLLRLLDEAEQILMTHDLDIQKNREQHKAIRRGEWTKEQVLQHFSDKERQLEELYVKSTLRSQCDDQDLKALLLECLEMHYGDLSDCVRQEGEAESILRKIADLTEQARSRKLI